MLVHALILSIALLPLDYTEANGGHILDNELRLRLVDVLPAGVKLSAIFDSRSTSVAPLDLEHYACNNVYVPWGDQYYEVSREGHSNSPPNPRPLKPVFEHKLRRSVSTNVLDVHQYLSWSTKSSNGSLDGSTVYSLSQSLQYPPETRYILEGPISAGGMYMQCDGWCQPNVAARVVCRPLDHRRSSRL